MAWGTGDEISVVTGGLVRGTGSFAERLVSRGFIGDILTAPSVITKLLAGAFSIYDRLSAFREFNNKNTIV